MNKLTEQERKIILEWCQSIVGLDEGNLSTRLAMAGIAYGCLLELSDTETHDSEVILGIILDARSRQ